MAEEPGRPEEKPRLRGDLRILPTQGPGGRALVIQDPLGLMREPMAVGGQALELLPMLDGRSSILDLQTELTRRYGILITSEQVSKVITHFDESYLLDSTRYRNALKRLAQDFAQSDILPATHAGEAYPSDPDMLGNWIEGMLSRGKDQERIEGQILAIVAPHIDLRVGAEVYADAYAPARNLECDRVIILGVGHSMREGLVCLTAKDIETPLGRMASDRELVRELQAVVGQSATADDFAFRGEHSVEFQAVLLQHVLKKSDIQVVPILCGMLEPVLAGHRRPSEVSGLGDFCARLRKALEEDDRKTLVIAGVDLSHVGPKFGDAMSSRAIAQESEAHDHKLLDALCTRDVEKFCAEGRTADGKFNVCGFGALACLLEILPEDASGRLTAYRNWHEEPTHSAVSFAAALFSR